MSSGMSSGHAKSNVTSLGERERVDKRSVSRWTNWEKEKLKKNSWKKITRASTRWVQDWCGKTALGTCGHRKPFAKMRQRIPPDGHCPPLSIKSLPAGIPTSNRTPVDTPLFKRFRVSAPGAVHFPFCSSFHIDSRRHTHTHKIKVNEQFLLLFFFVQQSNAFC